MSSSYNPINWTRGQRNVGKLVTSLTKNQDGETWNKWNFMGNCFWMIVYLAGIVLVALTCNDLYHKYKTEFTSINITAFHNNSLMVPDPTICLPNFHADEVIDYLYNLAETENMLSNHSEGYREDDNFYVNELQAFFDNCTSWQEAQKQDWPITLLHVAQLYLGMIFEAESFIGSGKHPMDYTYALTDNTTQSITDVLIPKMIQWNVSLGRFRDAFAQQFLRFYNIHPTLFIGRFNDSIGKNAKVKKEFSIEDRIRELVFVTRYQVCYKLDLNEFSFNDSTTIVIRIVHYNKVLSQKYGHQLRRALPILGAVAIDMSGKRRPGITTHPADSIFYAGFGTITQLRIRPSVHYTLMAVVKGKRKCSPYETKDECRAKCQRSSIAKLCNCTAISLDWLSDTGNDDFGNGSSCQFDQYETCLRYYTVNEDSDCLNSCLDSCTPSIFSFVNEGSNIFSRTNLYKFYGVFVEINVDTIDYLKITEYEDWTFARITGVVGGALSFWLGIDILTIVYYALISTILLIKDHCYLKYVKKDSVGNESVNSNNQNGKTEKLWRWFIKNFDLNTDLLNISKNDRFNWMLKKIIWLTLFFAGLALTIKDFVPLVTSYKSDGNTFILNVQFNRTIRLPDIAICNPIDATGNDALWTDDASGKVYRLYDRTRFDAYFNDKDMSKDVFLDEEKSWPSIAKYTVLLYLQAAHQITISTYDDMINYWHHYSKNNHFVPWVEFRSFLVTWSITDTELRQKFTSELAKWYRFEAECSPESGTASNFSLTPTISFEKTVNLLSYWSPTTLCFYLSLSEFEYKSVSDRCYIKMIRYLPIGPEDRYLNVNTYNPSSQDIDMALETRYDRIGVTFEYFTIYQRLESAACTNDKLSLWNCMIDCRNNLTDSCANSTVSPLNRDQNTTATWRKGREWEEYEKCLNLTVRPLRNCSNKCEGLPPCTRIEYTLNQAQGDTHESDDTIIDIYVKDFAYSLMKEQPMWSIEQFIAACGGVLGFWIGLDATFIIQIFFTPLMICIGVYIKTKDSATPTNNRHFALDYIAKMVGITYKGMSRLMIVKALIEKQFWIIVYAWFTILTANHCLHYIKQYRSTLESHFELIQNETFTIPVMTACIPLYPWLTDSTVDSKNHPADNEIIKKPNVTKSMILDPNLRWPIDLLKSTLIYLILMEGYKAPSNWSSTWSTVMNDYEEEPRALSEKMGELEITYKELIKKFDQEMRLRLRIDITKYVLINGSLQEQELSMERITFVSREKICYAPPSDAASFSSPLEYIKVTFHRTTPRSSRPHSEQCVNYYANFLNGWSTTIDLLGRDDGADLDDFVLRELYGRRKNIAISISRAVRVLPVVNGEKRCSTDTSRPVCTEQCRVAAVKLQCGCIPSECHFRQLDKCAPNFNDSDVINCIYNCLSLCERISYKYETNDITQQKNNINWCITEYRIGVANFQYPLFSESFDISFFDFIAAFGGLMSIWLPLDVIFFIDVVILLGKRLYSKKKKRQIIAQKESEDDKLKSNVEKEPQLRVHVLEID